MPLSWHTRRSTWRIHKAFVSILTVTVEINLYEFSKAEIDDFRLAFFRRRLAFHVNITKIRLKCYVNIIFLLHNFYKMLGGRFEGFSISCDFPRKRPFYGTFHAKIMFAFLEISLYNKSCAVDYIMFFYGTFC